ncbi:DNA polymerase III subunit alpha [Limibaculum sp. M0105]|uniref:DNA polymerase III subunit alpha n=1 Tax=Thermohalobaculum xanthum TaxID=2753746 RepID=A0A8J7SDD6_9RHOB|nr:DNA polymerase III subunit alpha [Thermohalobaculum xanthum]MBK0398367.1 DNA polymerase III subunit alpha [Thermohalobaculum xanthum]
MSEPRFIHLRVHSAFSLLEGAIHVKKLPAMAEKLGMPAVALCDTNNLFGALEFAETAAKAGIQPVMGLQLALGYAETRPGEKPVAPAPVALYAQNQAGWRNLMALTSAAWLDTDAASEPSIPLDTLARHAEGVICLTGGADGPLGRLIRLGRQAQAEALAARLAGLFPGRLYVELQRHGTGESLRTEAEEAAEPALIGIAYDQDLPLVATNDVYFADPAMFEAHDALLCIREGRYVNESDRRQITPEHWLKPPEAMIERFKDIPEAIENTVEIARRCAVRPKTHPPILPKFADDEVEELRRQAREGLAARLAVIPHAAPVEEYEQRLDFELGVIEQMGFPGYFLIVADFIKWAKAHDIPVGPGRGSGAGSLVAYALTITDLDPLRYGLLFERFLNPERVSMPDFDIDFCQDRREEVIRYVQERYGRDRVAQIITFGALLSKAAVRDVARVLQMPFSQGDRLSKLIPMEGVKPVSIAQARREEPRFAEEAARDENVGILLDIAEKIEGLYRNASTHAAGVVIGDRPLVELVPLYQDPKSDMPATQYNMKWVEPAGLVKFDFLGLKTLTVIQNAVDLLKLRGVELDIGTIPLDDQATYDLYARADTVGVFQVESAGMRDALRQLKPTCIEDIVALVALYRPGPMENIPTYCNVKHGIEKRQSLHPSIDPILDETQGIIVYQEQVMEIARVMAGYSLGGADLLRRAMGKKIKEAMDAERPKFVEGAAANGVSKTKAEEVFALLEKFANYGFNKSHAAAYALVSYQTGYLKANFPVEFMAAVMNLDLHLTDKLNIYVQECRRTEIGIEAPCVNRSAARFTVEDGRILYALGALKGVGVEAMRAIERARAEGGPFADLFDFARRVDLKAIGKRALEMLARAGALGALEPNRRRALTALDRLIDYSATVHEERTSSQVSLFGGGGEALPPPRLPDPEDWLPTERLREEHGAVGFYLSGHPLEDYMGALRRKKVATHAEFAFRTQRSGGTGRIAGTLASVQVRKSAKGNRFAFIGFSDTSGAFEVMAFSDVLLAAEGLLETGSNLVLTVEAEGGAEGGRLMLRAVQPIEQVIADAAASGLRVHVEGEDALTSVQRRLGIGRTAAGRAKRGEGPVSIVVALPELNQEVEIDLPGHFPVGPEIRGALKAVPGVAAVEEI